MESVIEELEASGISREKIKKALETVNYGLNQSNLLINIYLI